MKKMLLIVSVVAITFLVASMTQVSASSISSDVLKKTPGAQATAAAERWAANHPDQVKGQDASASKPANYRGEIVSVADGSIVINQKGDVLLTVMITEDTIIKIPGKKTDTSDLAGGLLVGMRVAVKGVMGTDDTFTAQRITVIPGKPAMASHVGTVTEYVAGTSITIENKNGDTFTYALDENTKYLPKDRMTDLQVGSLVTVIFGRNVNGQPIVAAGVVIHPMGTEVSQETETETESD